MNKLDAELQLELCRAYEQMVERGDAERHLQREMEFARQVQARLFPQKLPQLKSLEYAGRCIQARQVGGDYYDFLEMQPARLALVLADIAGKGLPGALLMANLQASVRSQYAVTAQDPRAMLTAVNRLFWENTADTSYATLFFAEYDEACQRLTYVNCGHVPPLIIRSASRMGKPLVERLEPTGTVLGLFKQWDCEIADAHFGPNDVLAIYSDGLTEASDETQNEFGETGLIDALDHHRGAPALALLDAVLDRAQRFQHGGQADDITLIIAQRPA